MQYSAMSSPWLRTGPAGKNPHRGLGIKVPIGLLEDATGKCAGSIGVETASTEVEVEYVAIVEVLDVEVLDILVLDVPEQDVDMLDLEVLEVLVPSCAVGGRADSAG